MSHYDLWGWHSETPIAGREAPVEPPKCRVGEKPNWTGHKWVCMPYKEPPQVVEQKETPADIIASIEAQLAKLREALK